jgi:SMI1-KNR4 cell-wall
MSVAELMAVVPPPTQPRDVGDLGAWSAAEARIAVRLPTSYRDFVFRYGTGVFNDPGRLCIFPRNPLAPGFDAHFRDDCDFVREMKELAERDEFPYGAFPPAPGLILWADDDNGCMFFWLTEGDPDRWPILVTPPRCYFWERFELSITSFLAQAFTRRLTCVPWQQPEFFSGPRPVKFAQERAQIEYQ